jgi:L-ascorbate metabolism protein UlaG (beta-lactamase superfamily)
MKNKEIAIINNFWIHMIKKIKLRITFSILLIIIVLSAGCTMVNKYLVSSHDANEAGSIAEKVSKSAQYNGENFENKSQAEPNPSLSSMLKMYLFDKQQPASPETPLQVTPISKAQLIALQEQSDVQGMLFFRLGHSSLLILLDGEYWLTDPVFSERASPFTFIGPKRFHETPIEIDQLPNIKGVILSHNHYDHLDKKAIKQLIGKVEHFYTPLGVGEDLIKWGVKRRNVTQLDWWESVEIKGVRLTATPAQHFSGRALTDKNQTLWSSWAVKGLQGSFFFSGDSGDSDQFKLIGDKLGPFDFSFMETGAYNQMWSEIHMSPRESAQAHIDIKGRYLVPIHNGTFDLSFHAWNDPFEQIYKYAQALDLSLLTPLMGQQVNLRSLKEKGIQNTQWWRE